MTFFNYVTILELQRIIKFFTPNLVAKIACNIFVRSFQNFANVIFSEQFRMPKRPSRFTRYSDNKVIFQFTKDSKNSKKK